ncbi:sulfotransferase family protein [Stieleria varia]|uniref:sulfotransferase n=1 Tax=Stieleria varia TaxID=2528005 RepID=UPI0018D25BF7|nr:sulfotransferase [Stieleria varia]
MTDPAIPQTKCMILTSQRSGSVFLQKYLHSHPEICCHGEVLLGLGGPCGCEPPAFLNRHRRARLAWAWVFSGAAISPNRVIDRTLDSAPDARAVAFRGMYNQLQRQSIVEHLLKIPNLKIIHLMRDDLLRQYVSRKQMHHRYNLHGKGSAHTSKPLKLNAISISPAAAIAEMTTMARSRETLHKAFENNGNEILTLHYERLLQSGSVEDSDRSQLCDFLGVSDQEMTSDLVKMSKAPLEDLVDNYDELKSVLQDTEFADLLDAEQPVLA